MGKLLGKKKGKGPQGPTGANAWIARNEERKAKAEQRRAEQSERIKTGRY